MMMLNKAMRKVERLHLHLVSRFRHRASSKWPPMSTPIYQDLKKHDVNVFVCIHTQVGVVSEGTLSDRLSRESKLAAQDLDEADATTETSNRKQQSRGELSQRPVQCALALSKRFRRLVVPKPNRHGTMFKLCRPNDIRSQLSCPQNPFTNS